MTKKKRQTKTKKSKGWQPPKNLMEAYVLNRECRDNPLFKLPEITPDFEAACAFFDDLFQNRMNEDEYSVKEIAEKRGISYEQVLDWAKQNDLFAFGLDMAKEGCFANAVEASIHNDLEWEKAVRYCVENIDEQHEEKDFWLQELKKIEQQEIIDGKRISVMVEKITQENTNQVQTMHLQNDIERERINKWREKKAKETPSFKLALDQDNKKMAFVKNPEKDEDETIASTLTAALGSTSTNFNRIVLSQTEAALYSYDYGYEVAINASIEVLLSMNPQDEFDATLCRRLLVLDNHYMQMMMSSAQATNIDTKERYINMATKLGRLHNETLEALNKYRRKGEQKVTVTHNHVQVNGNARAIVGSEINQHPGGGDHDKK